MKEKKKATWEMLATEHGLKDGETASKKWVNLRDYYAKSKKKQPTGSAAKRGKSWPYMEAMSFYQSQIEPNPSRCDSSNSVKMEDADEDILLGTSQQQPIENKENDSKPCTPKAAKRVKPEITEEDDMKFLKDVAAKVEKAIDEPEQGDPECNAFGVMVAKKLEKMSEYQRAQAEQGILQLITNITFGSADQQYTG